MEQFQRTSEPSKDVSDTIRLSRKEAMKQRAMQIKEHPESMTEEEIFSRINEIEDTFHFQQKLEAYMPSEFEQKIVQMKRIRDEGGVRLAEVLGKEMGGDVSEYEVMGEYFDMQEQHRKETLQELRGREASLKQEQALLSQRLEELRKLKSPYDSSFAA